MVENFYFVAMAEALQMPNTWPQNAWCACRRKEREPLAAVALTTDTFILTPNRLANSWNASERRWRIAILSRYRSSSSVK